MVGTLNWLSLSTIPDIATITNMLSYNLHNATPSHVAAAKYVIRYLTGTKELGIEFNNGIKHQLDSFVKFPVTQITGLCNATWGPKINHTLSQQIRINRLNYISNVWSQVFSFGWEDPYIGCQKDNQSQQEVPVKQKSMCLMNARRHYNKSLLSSKIYTYKPFYPQPSSYIMIMKLSSNGHTT